MKLRKQRVHENTRCHKLKTETCKIPKIRKIRRKEDALYQITCKNVRIQTRDEKAMNFAEKHM